MPDNKQMVSFHIKITVQFRRNHPLQNFPVLVHIRGLANLPMINVPPAASGLNCQLVIIRQILRRGYRTAALGIISGQSDQIYINHRLFQFAVFADVLFILVFIRHQLRQLAHMLLETHNQPGSLMIDNSDPNAEHILVINLNAGFPKFFEQRRIVINRLRHLIIIVFPADGKLQIIVL